MQYRYKPQKTQQHYVNTDQNKEGRAKWAKEVITALEARKVLYMIDETGYG